MESAKKSFVLYLEYKENLEMLTYEQKGILLDMIFEYCASGIIIEADPIIKMAFLFIKGQLDRDNEKYQKVCERNRKNGQLGGRPKKQVVNIEAPNNPNGLSNNPLQPKQPDTDNDTDIDNDNDTDIDNGIDTDIDGQTNRLVAELANHYLACFRRLVPPIHLNKLVSYLDNSLELDLIKYIMEYSSDKNEPWKYCCKVLENSANDMITTLDQFKIRVTNNKGEDNNGFTKETKQYKGISDPFK